MKTPAVLAVAVTALLTLSACGGNSTTASDTAARANAGSSAAGLHTASTSLGTVLVDSSGRTVYVLSTDGPNRSTCSTSCLQLWPAVAPGGHAGVTAKVGSTATQSGTMTATVAGHPVYTFSGDQGPGDVNGEGLQDFGGVWYAVSPSGTAVTAGSGSSSSPPAPYTGRGY
jgi:predicted lipoprotein with Yx(FWY)xxD motif